MTEKYANFTNEKQNTSTNMSITSSDGLQGPPQNMQNAPSPMISSQSMQQGYPMQPGMDQMQPGMAPVQTGMPMQPGMMPMQPGMAPMQPGMAPMQPGMVPMQPGMMPMQPGMMPMQGGTILFKGVPMMIIADPLAELASATTALVAQEMELLEIITNCETPNRYHVFLQDAFGNSKYLFKCKEESSCFQRNCCPAGARGFQMNIKHVISQISFNDDFSKPYLRFDKPFKCTCCCLARPEMKGLFVQSKQVLGKVQEPCTFCDPVINVFGKDGNIRYKITTSCCQCGYCCRNNICGKLSEITFRIYNGNQSTEGKGVGTITREVKGVQNIISDADSFRITFPVDAKPEEKLLIIGATLMIDYQYYENAGGENPNMNRRNGGLLY